MNSKKTLYSIIIFSLVIFLNAQPGSAAVRLAVMVSSGSHPFTEGIAGLKEYLEHPGDTFEYDIFHLESDYSLADSAIQEIITKKPKIIITFGALAFDAATDSIGDIPIVAGIILNKEKIMKHPNATGVVLEIPFDSQFAWMKKILPSVKNIGVLYNPDLNESRVIEASLKARELGLNLVGQPVPSPRNLPDALNKLANKVDVLWGINDSVIFNKKTAKNLLLFSFRNKIPFVGLSNAWVKAGAYYSLDRDYHGIGIQCAEIVKEILAGTAVGSIEPAFPRHITFSVNSRTAKIMNMKIDQSLLNHAETVY